MSEFIIDNVAKIIDKEKSVLDIFKEKINKAIEKNKEISFKVAVGFFFFEGFQMIYQDLKKLYDKGLLKEFKLVMGPETRRKTKEILEALKNDAASLDEESYNFIKKLYNENKFDFRVFLERDFHIKLYMFEIGGELEVWAGSANLTSGGLQRNIELIVPVNTSELQVRDLYREFFKKIWEKSTDKVENLRVIDTIEKGYRSEMIYLHPREFIINLIKILGKEYLLKNPSADLSYLAEFQNMSYYLCINKLNKYGGCILANSFGLGKTDVGSMVVRYYKELGKNVLVIYPPVVKGHWERTLEKVGLNTNEINFLSRGLMQKSDFDYEKYKNIDLIIVDEAHHFRVSHPKSNRRENLENIIKINPNCHVLLITATPINTSMLDFTELLKLFILGRYKEKFESEGVISKIKEIEHSIKQKQIDKKAIDDLNDLIKLFSVRVEWSDITVHFKEDLKKIANVEDIEHPKVSAVKYSYDEEIAKKIFDVVVNFLGELNFEYTKLWEKEEYKEDKNLMWWYKWRLYKRLESSITAFKVSLEKFLQRNEFLLKFLDKASSNPNYMERTNLFPKERLENIRNTFISLEEHLKKKVLGNISKDIKLINEMLKEINSIKELEQRDNKIEKLLNILEEEKKHIIIFSESSDTVKYIGKILRKRTNLKFKLAYGDAASIIDEESNETFNERDKEKIEKDFNEGKFDILVSTDIMGEGVNLPKADVVINFDLPYNPVRLIQRDGRAIRITNPKKIHIYNFEPDERIDKELELCNLLAERVDNIISTIGIDFLIWAVEEGKIKEVSERNRKRTVELIREFRHLLATKGPEELGKKIPITLSEEDLALRDFIKYWNISQETIELNARNYKKPIFTSLSGKVKEPYFIVYEYNGSIYTYGSLNFLENKGEDSLNKEEINKIKDIIVEKCLEMDREYVKVEYKKDTLTKEIEKLIEKESLEEMFRDIDISTIPKRGKELILKYLKEITDVHTPPFKKDKKTEELKKILSDRFKYYKRNVRKEPRILAVIKYVRR